MARHWRRSRACRLTKTCLWEQVGKQCTAWQWQSLSIWFRDMMTNTICWGEVSAAWDVLLWMRGDLFHWAQNPITAHPAQLMSHHNIQGGIQQIFTSSIPRSNELMSLKCPLFLNGHHYTTILNIQLLRSDQFTSSVHLRLPQTVQRIIHPGMY